MLAAAASAKACWAVDLAQRVAVTSLRRELRVVLVGRAVLVEHRTTGHLVDVGLGDDCSDAGGDQHPAHGRRAVDAGDDVVARAAHVVGVVVGAHVGDVGDAVAPGEDLVEAPGHVEVGGVQRQPPGGVGVHRREEADLAGVVDVAHAGAHPVAALQQPGHHPPADEPGGAGDGDHSTLRYCRHRQTPSISATAPSLARMASLGRSLGSALRRGAAARAATSARTGGCSASRRSSRRARRAPHAPSAARGAP